MHIGFSSLIHIEHVRIILHPHNRSSQASKPTISAPLRRLIAKAEKEGRLINASHGRRVRAIIITDSNHVVLSGINAETLKLRYEQEKEKDYG